MSLVRSLSWAFLALTLLLSSLARAQTESDAYKAPAPDGSEQADEARAHFMRGNELYAAGDIGGTLAEFERAFALRPSPLLCFYIGKVATELRRYARAFRAYSAFLARTELAPDGASDPATDQRRLSAKAALRDLEPRIARLRVTVNVDGAHLSVDEQPIGDSPLKEALVLDVGTVRVRAWKSGYAAVTREIALAGADDLTLDLTLEALEPPLELRAQAPVAPSVQAEPVAPAAPLMTPGLWAGFGAAAALGVLGAAAGIYALSEAAELDRRQFFSRSAKRDFERESQRVHAFAVSSDVMLAAALVSAQTSLVVLLVRRSHLTHRASVSAALQPRGLVLHGQF